MSKSKYINQKIHNKLYAGNDNKKDEGINLLLQFCKNQKQKEKLLNYYDEIIDSILGLDIEYDFVGFMQNYLNISNLLNNHPFGEKYIIYDIGSSHCMQQLLFQNNSMYIGVDKKFFLQPKKIINNFSYHEGSLINIETQLKKEINDFTDKGFDMFGIANMSILYDKDKEKNKEIFYKLFDKCFII